MAELASKTKFLVLGSAGMVGHMVTMVLREKGYSVIGIDAKQPSPFADESFDLSDFDQLLTCMKWHEPGYIVNCAALLGKAIEEKPELAKQIDAELPHFLADYCNGSRTKLVHISTDFVFSGDRPGGGYSEDDVPDNQTVYGRLKAAGEVHGRNVLNIRLSVIGPTPFAVLPNYFNNVVASSAASLWGLSNAFWTGITSLELTKFIATLPMNWPNGNIVHLVSKLKQTRLDSIAMIADAFGVNLPIEQREGPSKDYSLLSTVIDYRQSLEGQLSDLKRWMIDHPEEYGHYFRRGS